MKKQLKPILVALFFVVLAVPVAYAQTTKDSELTQEINAGALSTDIVDSDGDSVANPSFAMGTVSVSTIMQVATGTFGENEQRILVDNPDSAASGWTLTIAGTDGPGDTEWDSGADQYAFDDSPANGQLTLDPSVANLVALLGGSTGISLGTQDSFDNGTVDSITLLSASGAAATIWRGYITGVDVSQTIPAGQPAGSYTLDLTQTVTAN